MRASVKIGERFGRLTVISRPFMQHGASGGRSRSFVLCLCDCGNEHEVSTSQLQTDKTASCGCKQKIREHGGTMHPLYHKWKRMRRMKNTVPMATSWYQDPWVFYKWSVANGWKESLITQLRRKISSEGFTPENCFYTNTETKK